MTTLLTHDFFSQFEKFIVESFFHYLKIALIFPVRQIENKSLKHTNLIVPRAVSKLFMFFNFLVIFKFSGINMILNLNLLFSNRFVIKSIFQKYLNLISYSTI